MKQRMTSLQEQVNKTSMKYNEAERDARVADVTVKEVNVMEENSILFERTGRMFVHRTRDNIVGHLKDESAESKKLAEKLKVLLAQLNIKTKQEMAAFQQLYMEVQKAQTA